MKCEEELERTRVVLGALVVFFLAAFILQLVCLFMALKEWPSSSPTDAIHNAREILAAHAHPGSPIVVQIVELGEDWADSEYDEVVPRFVIRIDNDVDPDHATELMAHEWAHCLTWGAEGDHSDEWGAAYARCYRLLFED